MNFFVSRVSIPPAVILFARGEIGTAGQKLLQEAITAELAGKCPIILDLRDVKYVAEQQFSGPILNAQIDAHYSGRHARRMAILGADERVAAFLQESLGQFLLICESEEQALVKLGDREPPREKEPGLYYCPRGRSAGREIDREEYLGAFEQWFLVLEMHKRYRSQVPGLRLWWSRVVRENLPDRADLAEFCARMPGLPRNLHLTVLKSNLLYRMLYLGEPVRQRRCPGTKHTSGGREYTDHPYLQCQCGGCGWLL